MKVFSPIRESGGSGLKSSRSAPRRLWREFSAIKETGGEIEHEPLPTVGANASQLVQLRQNLIGNALKYQGAAAPRIKISALRAELMWIFSIFQRLHTRDEYPGTGIRLSLCRRIVEQAGGLIWINSELGKGSTFYFTLPAIS